MALSVRLLSVLALSLAACGDDGVKHLADAPIGDDDAPIDAPATVVTVNLRISGTGKAGVKVYFQGPDSSEIAAVDTDANGVATAVMPNGGSVTVLDPGGYVEPPPPGFAGVSQGTHQVKTWMGVKPGDVLYLDESVDTSTPRTFKLTVPADPTVFSYHVAAACTGYYGDYPTGSGGTFTAQDITAYCDPSVTTTDITVASFDGSGNSLGTGKFVASVALDSTTPVDVTLAPLTTKTPKYKNLTSDYNVLAAQFSQATQGGMFEDSHLNSVRYDLTNQGVDMTFPWLAVPQSILVEYLFPDSNLSNLLYANTLVRWGSQDPIDSDLSAEFLLGFTGAPTFDATTRHATFAVNAIGATPDASLIFIRNSHFDETTSVTTEWDWRIVAPYGLDTTVPTLPAALAMYQPVTADVPDFQVTNAKVPGGYDTLRSVAFVLDPYTSTTFQQAASGKLAFVDYQPPIIVTKPTHRAAERFWPGAAKHARKVATLSHARR